MLSPIIQRTLISLTGEGRYPVSFTWQWYL